VAAATSGRTTAILLSLVVWSSSCSTPSPDQGPERLPNGSFPEVASRLVCLGDIPPQWASTLHDGGSISLPDTMLGLGTVAGTKAFGQHRTSVDSGIGALDLTNGRFQKISTFDADVGGMGAIAVEQPWVVWEQLDSRRDLTDWSMKAFNLETGAEHVLANSHDSEGSKVVGQQPIPVLAGSLVAWSQPVSTANEALEAEVRILDLRTFRHVTVDSGLVSSPVFAGPYLIWAKRDQSNAFTLKAIDALTHEPVRLPSPLQRPGTVGYLGGSPDFLVWSDQTTTRLSVWHLTTDTFTYFKVDDHSHYFQFLSLAGHFLLWFTGSSSAVLDLTTGNGFDFDGTVAGSQERIALVKASATVKGTIGSSEVASLLLTEAPELATCSR